MGTWELSKATSALPKLTRVLLVGRQRRQALTDACLVRRLASTRNAGVQSKSRQKRYRENDKETLQRPPPYSVWTRTTDPPHPPARRRRCPPSVPGCTTHVGMSMGCRPEFPICCDSVSGFNPLSSVGQRVPVRAAPRPDPGSAPLVPRIERVEARSAYALRPGPPVPLESRGAILEGISADLAPPTLRYEACGWLLSPLRGRPGRSRRRIEPARASRVFGVELPGLEGSSTP